MLSPYTQDELVDMSIRNCQKLLEPLSTWILYLWDMGMEKLLCQVLKWLYQLP